MVDAKRKTSIIFDEPSDTDAFEGAGHERSAAALADAIEKLANRNGAIGLEGKWGSGKSTVIRIAKSQLEKAASTHKYHLFNFDLWAHQTDDFRRAFLETFVSWAEQQKLLPQASIDNARDVIRDRIKVITHNNSKKYSWLVIPFVFLTPALPVMYAWLSPVVLRPGMEQVSEVGIFAGLASGLFILIYTAFTFAFFFSILRFPFKKKFPFIRMPFRNPMPAFSKLLAIARKDVEQETIKQNIREEDPSTIEFYKVFRNLLAEIQTGDKRVVAILDNIDRLPENCVPDVWSEIRSVFANEVMGAMPEKAAITVVLPYDKKYIHKAFYPKDPKSQDKETEHHDNAGDIFNKTFSRILRVSPPVANDWRNFMEQQIVTAFDPALPSDVAMRLFKLLQHSFQTKKTAPTPRVIVDFINELSALYEQWGEQIPLESMALYILHRDKIEVDPQGSLIGGGVVSKRFKHIAETETLHDDLAALAFNVHPDKARQVLLGTSLHTALTDSGPEELKKLAKTPGFIEILSDELSKKLAEWSPEDPELVSAAANNLAAVQEETKLEPGIWNDFADSFESLGGFTLKSFDELEGIFVIVKQQQTSKAYVTASALLKLLQRQAKAEIEESIFDGAQWGAAIYKIAEILKAKLKSDDAERFLKEARIPKAPKFTLDVAHQCSQTPGFKFRTLNRVDSAESVLKELLDVVNSSPDYYLAAIEELYSLFNITNTVQHLQAVADVLRAPQTSDAHRTGFLTAFFKLYTKIKDEDRAKAKTALESFVTDGTLIWNAHKQSQLKNHHALSMAKWLLIEKAGTSFATSPEHHSQLGSLEESRNWYQAAYNQTEPEEIRYLASYVSEFAKFTTWAKYAETKAVGALFAEVFREVVRQGTFNNLNVEESVTHYASYKKILGEDLAHKYLVRLARWEDHFKDLEDDDIESIDDELFDDIEPAKAPMKKLLKAVDEYLKKSTEEQWFESLKEEDDRLRLLLNRVEHDQATMLVGTYNPAVLKHAKSVIEGQSIPDGKENWKYVIAALKPANKQKLQTELLQALPQLEITQPGCDLFIELYGNLLIDPPLQQEVDKLSDYLMPRIASSSSPSVQEFIRNNSKLLNKILSEMSGEAKSRLQESLEEAEAEWGKELSRVLGIKIARKDAAAEKKNESKSAS